MQRIICFCTLAILLGVYTVNFTSPVTDTILLECDRNWTDR
jgi:hypothetical protein